MTHCENPYLELDTLCWELHLEEQQRNGDRMECSFVHVLLYTYDIAMAIYGGFMYFAFIFLGVSIHRSLVERSVSAVDLEELILNKVPIHNLPPVLNVLSTAIFIVPVIGMLPKVKYEQRGDAGHREGALSVVRVHDLPLTLIINQPGISTSLQCHCEL